MALADALGVTDVSEWLAAREAARGEGLKGTCSAQWTTQQEIAFKCSDCEADGSCAVCVDCYFRSSHEGHDSRMILAGEGCCDCGDISSWKVEGCCPEHPGLTEAVYGAGVALEEQSLGLSEKEALVAYMLQLNATMSYAWENHFLGRSEIRLINSQLSDLLPFIARSFYVRQIVDQVVLSPSLLHAICMGDSLDYLVAEALRQVLLALVPVFTFKRRLGETILKAMATRPGDQHHFVKALCDHYSFRGLYVQLFTVNRVSDDALTQGTLARVLASFVRGCANDANKAIFYGRILSGVLRDIFTSATPQIAADYLLNSPTFTCYLALYHGVDRQKRRTAHVEFEESHDKMFNIQFHLLQGLGHICDYHQQRLDASLYVQPAYFITPSHLLLMNHNFMYPDSRNHDLLNHLHQSMAQMENTTARKNVRELVSRFETCWSQLKTLTQLSLKSHRPGVSFFQPLFHFGYGMMPIDDLLTACMFTVCNLVRGDRTAPDDPSRNHSGPGDPPSPGGAVASLRLLVPVRLQPDCTAALAAVLSKPWQEAKWSGRMGECLDEFLAVRMAMIRGMEANCPVYFGSPESLEISSSSYLLRQGMLEITNTVLHTYAINSHFWRRNGTSMLSQAVGYSLGFWGLRHDLTALLLMMAIHHTLDLRQRRGAAASRPIGGFGHEHAGSSPRSHADVSMDTQSPEEGGKTAEGGEGGAPKQAFAEPVGTCLSPLVSWACEGALETTSERGKMMARTDFVPEHPCAYLSRLVERIQSQSTVERASDLERTVNHAAADGNHFRLLSLWQVLASVCDWGVKNVELFAASCYPAKRESLAHCPPAVAERLLEVHAAELVWSVAGNKMKSHSPSWELPYRIPEALLTEYCNVTGGYYTLSSRGHPFLTRPGLQGFPSERGEIESKISEFADTAGIVGVPWHILKRESDSPSPTNLDPSPARLGGNAGGSPRGSSDSRGSRMAIDTLPGKILFFGAVLEDAGLYDLCLLTLTALAGYQFLTPDQVINVKGTQTQAEVRDWEKSTFEEIFASVCVAIVNTLVPRWTEIVERSVRQEAETLADPLGESSPQASGDDARLVYAEAKRIEGQARVLLARIRACKLRVADSLMSRAFNATVERLEPLVGVRERRDSDPGQAVAHRAAEKARVASLKQGQLLEQFKAKQSQFWDMLGELSESDEDEEDDYAHVEHPLLTALRPTVTKDDKTRMELYVRGTHTCVVCQQGPKQDDMLHIFLNVELCNLLQRMVVDPTTHDLPLSGTCLAELDIPARAPAATSCGHCVHAKCIELKVSTQRHTYTYPAALLALTWRQVQSLTPGT